MLRIHMFRTQLECPELALDSVHHMQALHMTLSLPATSAGGKPLPANERAAFYPVPSLLASLLGSSLASTLLGKPCSPSITQLQTTLKAVLSAEPAQLPLGVREGVLQVLPLLVAAASGVVRSSAAGGAAAGATSANPTGQQGLGEVSFAPQR